MEKSFFIKYKYFNFSYLRHFHNFFFFKLKGKEEFNTTELLSQHQLHVVILGESLVLKHVTGHTNTCSISRREEMERGEVSLFESMKWHGQVWLVSPLSNHCTFKAVLLQVSALGYSGTADI